VSSCTRRVTSSTAASSSEMRFGQALNLNLHFHMVGVDRCLTAARRERHSITQVNAIRATTTGPPSRHDHGTTRGGARGGGRRGRGGGRAVDPAAAAVERRSGWGRGAPCTEAPTCTRPGRCVRRPPLVGKPAGKGGDEARCRCTRNSSGNLWTSIHGAIALDAPSTIARRAAGRRCASTGASSASKRSVR
jgi:hypothetical protein